MTDLKRPVLRKSAAGTPADSFLEWREANLERVAVEARRRERSRTGLRRLQILHRRRFPALTHEILSQSLTAKILLDLQ
jgi:hypothetical protein